MAANLVIFSVRAQQTGPSTPSETAARVSPHRMDSAYANSGYGPGLGGRVFLHSRPNTCHGVRHTICRTDDQSAHLCRPIQRPRYGSCVRQPGTLASSVVLRAFQKNGVTSAGTGPATITIPAAGHKAQFVGQMIQGLPEDFTGVVELSSASPFVALTLRSLINNRKDFILTTFPIADANVPAPTPIVFPQIADGSSYATQFIFINASIIREDCCQPDRRRRRAAEYSADHPVMVARSAGRAFIRKSDAIFRSLMLMPQWVVGNISNHKTDGTRW
jgi:hypothetical protein